MEDQYLASLIDLYLAGVLSAEEWAELRHRLASSPKAREQFEKHRLQYQMMHPERQVPSAAEVLEDAREESEATQEAPLFLFPPPLVSAKLRAWCFGGAAVFWIATGLIALQWYYSKPFPPYQPAILAGAEPVATLRHAAGVAWVNFTNELFVGDTLPAGPLQISAGAIQLEFKRGATLVVEAPAELQLVSDNEAFLHSGKVMARVPETAHGFKITAPSVAVTDLGTEFGVLALPKAPAEVHVFSGVVEVAPPTARPKRITEGHASRVRGKRVLSLSSNRQAFLFEDALREREVAEHHERYARWRKAALELSSDPATVIHYTFEEQSRGSRYVNNEVGQGNAPAATVGQVEGCNWTAGRWPDKGAIAFGDKKDRIRFSVPNTLTSLTYMAWLRVDDLSSRSNALAITETMTLGEVHWQVYRDGRVALSSRSGSGSTVDQSWDRGLSPPVFTAERLGRWTHLVSVYDSASRTINHYVNGEFVSSTPIKRPIKLKLGAVEIGNWGVRVDQPRWASMKSYDASYLQRHWKGSVDEFALISRALTPEEIRRYYGHGRVSAGTILAKATP